MPPCRAFACEKMILRMDIHEAVKGSPLNVFMGCRTHTLKTNIPSSPIKQCVEYNFDSDEKFLIRVQSIRLFFTCKRSLTNRFNEISNYKG